MPVYKREIGSAAVIPPPGVEAGESQIGGIAGFVFGINQLRAIGIAVNGPVIALPE